MSDQSEELSPEEQRKREEEAEIVLLGRCPIEQYLHDELVKAFGPDHIMFARDPE